MKSKRRFILSIVFLIVGSIILFLLGRTIYRIITWDRLVKYEKANLMETNSGCKPPCWHGIIPGETNVNDVLSIIEMDPRLDSLKLEFEDNEYGKHIILKPGYILIGGELIILEVEDSFVKKITINDQIKMSLSEVLTSFGSPSSVFPVPGGPSGIFYWHLIMYYPDQGIVINICTDEDEDSREITPSSRVYYVMLTTKGVIEAMIQEYKDFQRKVKNPIVFPVPWKGYGNIYDLYEGSWW